METYRFLAGGKDIYLPPAPTTGVVTDPHRNLKVGQNFPPEIPIRHPDHLYNPMAQKAYQNRAILRPGEQSLNNHKVDVWDERLYKHMGLHPDSLTRGLTSKRDEALTDTAIVTHHSGQQVRYRIDPATGLYVYRGYVNPTHELDAPTWGNKNYYHRVDRSDYFATPPPVTPLSESNPVHRPVQYGINAAKFHKPLPDNFTRSHRVALTDMDKAIPSRAGTALTNKTRMY